MATVRIYKVAELLNTSSQEVIALLKRDHGIEVKSASSTIEEVVARQFVERLARQRNISVPSNASFADTPAAGQGPEARRQGARAGEGRARRCRRRGWSRAPSSPRRRSPVDAPAAAPPPEAETVLIPPPASPAPFVAEPVPPPAPVAARRARARRSSKSRLSPPNRSRAEEPQPAPAPVAEQPAAAA